MSKINRNNYSLEFKISAVKLAEESVLPAAHIASDLGVNVNTLYHWIAKHSDSNKINQRNMNNNEVSCFEESRRLKKELALVKQERDLLKKAAAYFAKGS